jgi:hypothetical protein
LPTISLNILRRTAGKETVNYQSGVYCGLDHNFCYTVAQGEKNVRFTISKRGGMLTTAIGVSDSIDHRRAIAAVLDQCEAALDGARPQAGILFTSIIDADFSYFLDQIATRFPAIELIGCTTDGEIVAGQGFIEDAVALLLLASDHLRFATAVACDLSTRGTETLPAAVADCRRRLGGKPALGIILPDGLTTFAVPFGRLIQQAAGKSFPVFGGTAGDH